MRGVIEKIDGMHATLRLEDGESLVWPTTKLPVGAHVASVIDVSLSMANIEGAEHADDSRRQLNDILASTPDE
jgi:hypothetical protein